MLSVFVPIRVRTYLFSLTWCLPSLAAKACQLFRNKNKKRGDAECVCVCASCRRVRHETGPDGHLRQSRLGLFTCFTLGHVSFVFSLAATRIKTRCQQSGAFIPPPPQRLRRDTFSPLQNVFLEVWDVTQNNQRQRAAVTVAAGSWTNYGINEVKCWNQLIKVLIRL